jgi:ribonuclease HI
MNPNSVIIYSDGACEGNPGPGGWAALLQYGDHVKEISGYEAQTTNNRMELTAALRALQALKRPYTIEFFTDSQYLRNGITQWMAAWRARNWRRKGGELANVDLWKALDTAVRPHQITWHWVKGHAGNQLNEKVDRLAKQALLKAKI